VGEADRKEHASEAWLTRGAVINVLGLVITVAVAAVAVPLLLSGLGRDRFGLLTLAWAAVGWFSVFDLGLSRATTHIVATSQTPTERAHARSVALMTIAALFGLGAIGGAVAAVATPFLISDVLDVPAWLRAEAETSFILLSASLPFVLGSSGARGALEGAGQFGWVNLIRVPSTVLLLAAPLLLLPITHDLRVMVMTITINRILAFGALYVLAIRALGPKRPAEPAPGSLLRRTLAYAGWTGATNALGTVLAWGYLDRYVVGAVLSVASVALYATPLEIVTKLLLYPMALMAVFFPAFARSHRSRDGRVEELQARALRATILPLMPLVIGGVAASSALLALYVGDDFADEATTVTQLLLLGAFCACVAQVPFTLLQACGRSDLTAKRHAAQLVIYVPLVIVMTSWLGIEGTAITWLLWASSDAVLLFYMVRRYTDVPLVRRFWLPVFICGATMLPAAALVSTVAQGWSQIGAGGALSVTVAGFLWLSLPEADKQAVMALFGRRNTLVIEA
jgi:O-antigen/teichoic acid export membrane protein